MGSNLVEYGPVELFNAEAEAIVRCVEDIVRLGRVGALGCQEGRVAELFDAYDFRFEFLAPCRSRAEKDAPALLCVLSFERVSTEEFPERWPERWGVVGAHHLRDGADYGVEEECAAFEGAEAESPMRGSEHHEAPVGSRIYLVVPCSLDV